MEIVCSRLRRGEKRTSRPELKKLVFYKWGETDRLALNDNIFYSHKRISYTSQASESDAWNWKNIIFLRGARAW